MSGTPRRDRINGPLTSTEAAKRLGIHLNTLKRISPRDLPFYRIGLGQRLDRRYLVEDINDYIERRMRRVFP